MNTPTKQIVYLPVKGFKTPAEEEGYFFTPEQLNEYTQHVIKQALETAAEKAYSNKSEEPILQGYRNLKDENNNTIGNPVPIYSKTKFKVDKQSITNTFEETFKIFEV